MIPAVIGPGPKVAFPVFDDLAEHFVIIEYIRAEVHFFQMSVRHFESIKFVVAEYPYIAVNIILYYTEEGGFRLVQFFIEDFLMRVHSILCCIRMKTVDTVSPSQYPILVIFVLKYFKRIIIRSECRETHKCICILEILI